MKKTGLWLYWCCSFITEEVKTGCEPESDFNHAIHKSFNHGSEMSGIEFCAFYCFPASRSLGKSPLGLSGFPANLRPEGAELFFLCPLCLPCVPCGYFFSIRAYRYFF